MKDRKVIKGDEGKIEEEKEGGKERTLEAEK